MSDNKDRFYFEGTVPTYQEVDDGYSVDELCWDAAPQFADNFRGLA